MLVVRWIENAKKTFLCVAGGVGELKIGSVARNRHLDGANQNEINQDAFSPLLINYRCKFQKLFQRDGWILRKMVEQGHLWLGERDLRNPLALLPLPDFQQNGIRDDVLVLHAHKYLVVALIVGGLVLHLPVLGNDNLKNRLAVDLPFLSAVLNLRLTIHLGGGLDHVDLLVGPDPGNGTVVLDPNQQPATISVGKRRQRTGNPLAVGNLKLEIQQLVLTLLNQFLYVVFPCLHHRAKVRIFFVHDGIGESRIRPFLSPLSEPFFRTYQTMNRVEKSENKQFLQNDNSQNSGIYNITINIYK